MGDVLEGRTIRGLGAVWQEGQMRGQLWQPCEVPRCRKEPVCAWCERCQRHCTCDPVSVQYAYFDPEP